MKKPKKPGKKPQESYYTYEDVENLSSSRDIDLLDLVERGFCSIKIDQQYDYVEVYAQSATYLHRDEYEKALEKWASDTKKWDEWLESDEGTEFQKKERQKELDKKEKSEKEKLARIAALKKELARLEK